MTYAFLALTTLSAFGAGFGAAVGEPRIFAVGLMAMAVNTFGLCLALQRRAARD